jgi:HemY protein
MIRLIIAVSFAVFTAVLGAFLALNPGTASFEFLGWHMEMSFVLAAALVVLFAFGMLVLWWLVFVLWTSPDKFKNFNLRRRREQGYDALEKALIASAAGDGVSAVRQAARADALLDRPALSRLLAARAAEAAGNTDGAETHYEALLEDPRTRLVAHRGLAQLAHDRSDHDATVDHARQAFEQAKGARWAFDALFDAHVSQGRWSEALDTLNEGERRKHVPADAAKRRRAVLLTVSAQAHEGDDTEHACELAEAAVRAAPGFAPAAALASRLLASVRRHKKAADVLEACWAATPHPAIAAAYRDLRKSDSKAKRIERLRSLSALQPEHRESQLLLVQAALDGGDAAAANMVLEPMLELGNPSARLCALAARLARLEGEDVQARRWMTRAAHAAAEADWSDMDTEGRAFPYAEADWKRMVYVYGDEGRLIHPRYERYETAAEAVPETALLEAPRPKPETGSITPGSGTAFVETARQPDDPGVFDKTDGKDGQVA